MTCQKKKKKKAASIYQEISDGKKNTTNDLTTEIGFVEENKAWKHHG